MPATEYQLIETADELRVACEELSRAEAVGFDTETTSLDPYNGRLRLVQLAGPTGPVKLIDLDRFADGDASKSEALAPLRRLLAAPRPIKVAHNCLAGDMLVSMADGTKVRIDKLVRARSRAKVLCVDEQTGALCTGDIVGWVDGGVRPWDDWLRIRLRGKGRLRVTKDHEILTERGRVRAENLVIGDQVLTSLPELSQQQRDMLYGSLLGDGSLTKQSTAQARTPYFKVSHSLKQEGYLALKAATLDGLVKLVRTEKVRYDGFSNSASGSHLISLTTKSDPRLFELYDNCLTGGKRTLTPRWLDNLSMPAVAVWYCDDGHLRESSASICVSAFGRAGAETLVGFLRSKGFPARLRVRADGQFYVEVVGPRGRGMSEELKRFWESIAPYVPASMQHKVPAAYRHLASDEYWATPRAQPSAFSDTVVEILPLLNDSAERGRYEGNRRRKRRGLRQYCLAVATHHNFVAGGVAVSNCKFDAKWVKRHLGVELGGLFDTLLASQLISAGETEDRHGLAVVAERYLGEQMDKTQQLSDWGGELSEAQLEYAARDAAVMLPLRDKLISRLKADGLIRVAQIEFECVVPVAGLELAGIYLDAARWREQIEAVKKKRAVIAEELQAMLAEGSAQGSLFANARADINLDSHAQLSAALKRLGVPVPDSTRNWKLQPLAKQYPVVAKLLDYRTYQKSLTSYGENLLEDINPKTGRIHAHFHQIGAPTGRMACTDPNVQQIPHAYEYRRCVRAQGEDRKLIVADYCVAKGTRVATARGLVPVEEVLPGDEAYLEDGSTARVAERIERGVLPVVKVTLKDGYSLTATALHRVRVLGAGGEYVWRRLGELRPTDFVAIQPARGLPDGSPYRELPAAARTHFNNHALLRTPPLADERVALFLGYVSGDGCLRRGALNWVVNSQDTDVSAALKQLAAELFGLPVHDRGTYRGVCEAGVYSVPLAEWCRSVGVSKERVPDFLWASRPSVVAAYLRGLFESDGSVSDSETGKVSFASSRGRLAFEVQQLLLALGIPANLRRQQGTGPGRRFSCWTVSVVAAGLTKFAGQVGFVSARKRRKLSSLVARWTGKTVVGNMPNLGGRVRSLGLSGEARRLLNNTASLARPVSVALAATLEREYPEVASALELHRVTRFNQLFLPVVSVEPAGEREVYDLSVPGPVTYISDGFVSHNSQIELRILAHVTEDKGFIEAFNTGADLHRVTAAQIFNVPADEVTKEQRDFAKRLNFGVVYGIGAQRFSMMTGLPLADAEQIMARYFQTYRGLDAWLREAARRAVRERTARTIAGRLARFNFDPEDRQAASLAQRNGKNMPIQGCVRKGTRILTIEHGYAPIEEAVFEEVRIWDGQEYVSAAVIPSGLKRLVRLGLRGGYHIECSPEHKFWAIDANGRGRWLTAEEIARLKQIYIDLTAPAPDWELPFNLEVFKARESGLRNQPGAKPHNAKHLSLEAFSDRFKLGLWLGRLASDGSVPRLNSQRPGSVVLMVAEHEEAILPELVAMTGTFGHFRLRTRITKTQPHAFHSLTVGSVSLAGQLLHHGIKERVPDFLWKSKSALRGYLSGLFDGDGTVHPDGPILTFGKGPEHHLGWARQIQQALLLFGVRSRLNCCKDRINVRVLKRDAPMFAEQIGFMNPAKQAKVASIVPQAFVGGSRIYGRAARVQSVEITDEWVEMFDVVNSASRRFMANGMVTHNSSADILKRALRLLHDRLKDTSAEIVNIVHDEVVVEADADAAEEVARTVERSMCGAGEEFVTRVPVKVESQIGDEWVK